MSNPVVEEIKWTDILVAGAGGGAIYGIADPFLSKWLPAEAKVAGITLKDIALILLGKYGAERTTGHTSTALKGMAVIGVYKVVYPQFIEPMIKGFIPAGSSPSSSPVAAAPSALDAALAYARM